MKRRFLLAVTLVGGFLLICFAMGQTSWHLDRNQYNDLPAGKLTLQQDTLYQDTLGRSWIRLPASMNAFHQPDDPVSPPKVPYARAMTPPFPFTADHPNLKFLCLLPSGESMEAILQPDGTYLTTGPKQGTYNYGHPVGFWGMVTHTLWDVLPHFANGNYR